MQTQVFGDLAFVPSRQVQFLNLMAHSQNFYDYAFAIPVLVSDFTMPACQLVFEVLSNYYRRHVHTPKPATLSAMVADACTTGKDVQTELTPEEYESLANVMNAVCAEPAVDEDWARDELLTHVKDVRTKQVMARYADAVARGMGADSMLKELAQVSALQAPNSDIRLFSLLGDADDTLVHTRTALQRIPTGLVKLDTAILGGLSASLEELGIGVACTGIGKTNMLLNFALAAAQAGYDVLLISLELTRTEMTQRAFSMAAHINARIAGAPVSEAWSTGDMLRYEFITRSKLCNRITIAEMRNKQYSMSDIDRVIDEWRSHIKRTTGTDEKCKLVLIDWLDLLVPDLKNSKKKDDGSEWVIMNQITQDLKRVQAGQQIAAWTVTQGNRGSVTADKMRMDHVASGFSKIWHVSVALGLTAPLEDTFIDEGVDDDNLRASSAMDCNRDLTLNIMKNRNGPKFSMTIYQGPSLKFWPSRGTWNSTKQLLDQGDMYRIFGNIT